MGRVRREMEARDTVMSVREIAALLRGMPYHPSNEAGWVNFVRRCLNAQDEISFKAGRKEMVEWILANSTDGEYEQLHYCPNCDHNIYGVPSYLWKAKLKKLGLGPK